MVARAWSSLLTLRKWRGQKSWSMTSTVLERIDGVALRHRSNFTFTWLCSCHVCLRACSQPMFSKTVFGIKLSPLKICLRILKRHYPDQSFVTALRPLFVPWCRVFVLYRIYTFWAKSAIVTDCFCNVSNHWHLFPPIIKSSILSIRVRFIDICSAVEMCSVTSSILVSTGMTCTWCK